MFCLFSFSDALVTSLEPCPVIPFDASRFVCLNAEVLSFITSLSGLTGEVCIRFSHGSLSL